MKVLYSTTKPVHRRTQCGIHWVHFWVQGLRDFFLCVVYYHPCHHILDQLAHFFPSLLFIFNEPTFHSAPPQPLPPLLFILPLSLPIHCVSILTFHVTFSLPLVHSLFPFPFLFFSFLISLTFYLTIAPPCTFTHFCL